MQTPNNWFLTAVVAALFITIGVTWTWSDIISPASQLSADHSPDGSRVRSRCRRMATTQLQYPYRLSSSCNYTLGKTFKVDPKAVEEFELPRGILLDKISAESAKQFVFVTAASASRYTQSETAITGIQMQYPDKQILYYDWGLEAEQANTVKQWCQVDLQPFDFSVVPHIKNLHILDPRRYQISKIFVILKALKKHQAVFWFDSSVWFNSEINPRMFTFLEVNQGLAAFHRDRDGGAYCTTPPHMYKYFPIDTSIFRGIRTFGSGSMFFTRTQSLYDGVLWWSLLCALDPGCMLEGNYTTKCLSESDPSLKGPGPHFLKCSKFDQSVLNILTAAHYEFNHHEYFYLHRMYEIRQGKANPKVCK